MTLSMHSIAYEAGERVSIETLFSEPSDRTCELLKKDAGLQYYRRSDDSSISLALSSVRKSLELANIAPVDVGALIYASNSFEQYTSLSPVTRIGTICTDLGMTNAVIHGIAYNDCANFLTGLSLAAGLVKSGAIKHAIVVTTDRCIYSERRVSTYGDNTVVYSDAAASCVISSDCPRDFELVSVDMVSDHMMPSLMETDRLAFSNRVRSCLQRIVRSLSVKGFPVSEAQVITLNTSKKAAQGMSFGLQVSPEHVFGEGVAEFAHTYGADTLIGCRLYLDSCLARKQDVASSILMVLGIRQTWGAVALRRIS